MSARRAAVAATCGEPKRENRAVHAAAARFELHVPHSRSLKEKRAAIRPIVDALRHRYHVSVAEVDHVELRQRAALGVAVVAGAPDRVEELLATVERVVATAADVELLATEVTWLDLDAAEARVWR